MCSERWGVIIPGPDSRSNSTLVEPLIACIIIEMSVVNALSLLKLATICKSTSEDILVGV